MKIISGPNKWTKQVTCNECRSLLEIEPEDVKAGTRGGDWQEAGSWTYYVECPTCEEEIYLEWDEIPKVVKNLVATKYPRP